MERSPLRNARVGMLVVIRMHMWESIIESMQAAMDSPLYEDEPELEARVRDLMGG